LAHYGLREAPFKITADARFFYAGGGRGDALHALRHALAHDEGIVLVTGEVGTGKSLLCRMLVDEPPADLDVVFLPNPSLAGEQLVAAAARDLGADPVPTALEALQRAAIERHARGRRVAVLVDEAHAMSPDALERIRLLTNLETGARKLLTVALFAQPELLATLARETMRPLRDRIVQHFRLQPLRADEVADYVNFRLQVAGHRGGRLFEPGALKRIARRSAGRSRRVNVLADRSLLACYTRGGRCVSPRDVARSEHDLDLAPPRALRAWFERAFAHAAVTVWGRR
ncbi:MAG: AAA family ATPase, partial [Pseudomonadota bacterium]